jgi:hypothetical protein
MAKEKRQIKTRGQQQALQSQPAQTGNRPAQRQAKPQDEMLKKHGDKIRNVGG